MQAGIFPLDLAYQGHT